MYFSTKMATFRDAGDALMLANDMTLIDDEELLLLYDLNSSKNLDLPYWRNANMLSIVRLINKLLTRKKLITKV